MTTKQQAQFNKMLRTLKKISKQYQTPAQLEKSAGKSFGLAYVEALEMAYENIQSDAAFGCKGIREIKIEKPVLAVAGSDLKPISSGGILP